MNKFIDGYFYKELLVWQEFDNRGDVSEGFYLPLAFRDFDSLNFTNIETQIYWSEHYIICYLSFSLDDICDGSFNRSNFKGFYENIYTDCMTCFKRSVIECEFDISFLSSEENFYHIARYFDPLRKVFDFYPTLSILENCQVKFNSSLIGLKTPELLYNVVLLDSFDRSYDLEGCIGDGVELLSMLKIDQL